MYCNCGPRPSKWIISVSVFSGYTVDTSPFESFLLNLFYDGLTVDSIVRRLRLFYALRAHVIRIRFIIGPSPGSRTLLGRYGCYFCGFTSSFVYSARTLGILTHSLLALVTHLSCLPHITRQVIVVYLHRFSVCNCRTCGYDKLPIKLLRICSIDSFT